MAFALASVLLLGTLGGLLLRGQLMAAGALLVAYLYADDRNVYYYAHMSEIIGDGDRGVGQGEPIGRVGQTGNAVIAGHVVTLNEGNVFRFLYQLDLDDQIQVWDDHERERDYHVVDVRLVPPTDTSVMDPTPDETLTLITCGGTFDPISREFSDRLIVVAKPV